MIQRGSLWEMTGRGKVITLIGAGGKTTSLQRLGQEVVAVGLSAILTTTTKVWPFHDVLIWRDPQSAPLSLPSACRYFWYVQEESESGKWVGPTKETVDHVLTGRSALEDYPGLEQLEQNAASNGRVWIIEGDGAKGKGLKFWAQHEPQIPLKTECAVLVIDGNLWSKKLTEVEMHRPELAHPFSGKVFNKQQLWKYLFISPVFSTSYAHMQWVVLLNEKDSGEILDIENLRPSKRDLDLVVSSNKPLHLRLAAGNSREGKMRWLDLW